MFENTGKSCISVLQNVLHLPETLLRTAFWFLGCYITYKNFIERLIEEWYVTTW